MFYTYLWTEFEDWFVIFIFNAFIDYIVCVHAYSSYYSAIMAHKLLLFFGGGPGSWDLNIPFKKRISETDPIIDRDCERSLFVCLSDALAKQEIIQADWNWGF